MTDEQRVYIKRTEADPGTINTTTVHIVGSTDPDADIVVKMHELERFLWEAGYRLATPAEVAEANEA